MSDTSILYETNKYQTPITKKLKSDTEPEVYANMMEFINTVHFVRMLVAPNRPTAKQMPKDRHKKIKVDITKPHILTNMEYFIKDRIRFEKFGYYTAAKFSRDPHSEYKKYWDEQLRRSIKGYSRSDGEWIPGYLYFYWNYGIMLTTKEVGEEINGKVMSDRVEAFPDLWEIDYFYYHYIDQAEKTGSYAAMLKCRGVGAAGPNSSKIATPGGWKTYGDIKENDYLIDREGLPTKVLEVYPQPLSNIYEVTFADERKTKCTLDHRWSVIDKTKGSANKDKLYTYTLRELIDKKLHWLNNEQYKLYKYYIPTIKPVKYSEKDLKIGPYALGLLLGDGSLSTKRIKLAVQDSDKDETLSNMLISLGKGFRVRRQGSKNKDSILYHIHDDIGCPYTLYNGGINPNGQNRLKYNLNVLKLNVNTTKKFIPEVYLLSSIEQRLELLQGLLDSDGSITKRGYIEFSNSNRKLAEDVAELARSLGISVKFGLGRPPRKKEMFGKVCSIKQEYRVYMRTSIPVFKLKRKLNRVNTGKCYSRNVAITKIKLLATKEKATCFLVDNKEHIYLNNDYIPTHNSFKAASMTIRNFFLIAKSKSYLTASFDGYLFEDGIVTKFIDMESFMQANTAFKKKKIFSKPNHFKSGFKDKAINNAHSGFLSEMITVNTKDPNSSRGKRGKLVIHEEFGSNRRGIDSWNIMDKSLNDRGNVFGLQIGMGCVCAGTNIMLSSGELLKVEDLHILDRIVGFDGRNTVGQNISYMKNPTKKPCIRLEFYGGEFLECSEDHPLMELVYNTSKKEYRASFEESSTFKKGTRVAVPNIVGKFGDLNVKDARLLGLMVGDGSYGKGTSPEVCSDDPVITKYIQDNYNTSVKKTHIQNTGVRYTSLRVRDFTETLRKIGMQGQTKLNKRFPNNIHLWDKESTSEFISGYYDADGNVLYRESKDVLRVVLTSIVYELLFSMKMLLSKYGIHSSIVKESRNSKPSFEYRGQLDYIYRLYINNQYDVQLFRKEFTLLSSKKSVILNKPIKTKNRNNSKIVGTSYYAKGLPTKGSYFKKNPNLTNMRYRIVKSISHIGEKDVYNLTADGTHTYLANGFITHNTGGDDQSDFFALTQIFFKPRSYNVNAIPNVFDKNSMNTVSGFFIGDYMNKPRSYDSSGVTNIVMNLLSIFQERFEYEKDLDDPDAIAKKKAESAITPLEAITVMHSNVFPKEAAKQAIADLSADYEDRTRGFHNCMLRRSGEHVTLNHSSQYFPIKEYPYTGKQAHNAAVTIKHMPKKLADQSIPTMRYIIGVDTLDDDDTIGSLFGIQVMDLWTDDIVAWYLGRHVMVEDDYEIVLSLCILYNATCNYENNLKGLYGHFKNRNSLRYLADTPMILQDKGYSKGGYKLGNKSKGTRATEPVNAWGRRLQAAWQRKEHVYFEGKTGIETIDDIEYLREISMHDPFGNFDKISTGNMLFIYREDLVKITESSKFGTEQNYDYNSDDFFDDFAPIKTEEEEEEF